VIVGGNPTPGFAFAFRWANGVAALIPQLKGIESTANSVSTDGTIIAGDINPTGSNPSGFTLTGTNLEIIPPSSKNLTTSGTIMSANGTVVAGNIASGFGTLTPYQWQNGALIQWPGSTTQDSSPEAVSPDGSVVVGVTDVGGGFNPVPFEWTNGAVTTLTLPSGFNVGSAMGVSNEGSTIVGFMMPPLSIDNKAFIWTQANGVQDLQQVLTADGLGSSLAGWTLTKATAITPDGYTIVGDGIDPQGQDEGWIANLGPPPPPPPPAPPAPITWTNPANIFYGMALGDAQLDASSSVPGTFTYSPPGGTILHAGAGQTLSVTFMPDDTTDWSTNTDSVSIDVVQATPTIKWVSPANIISGKPLSAAQLDATATWTVGGALVSVPGTLTYSPPAGTELSAGNHTLSVSFSPTDTTDYTGATDTVRINVLPPSLRQPTETSLAAKPRSANLGHQITLTATVKNRDLFGGTPTGGVVNFYDGGALLGWAPLVFGRAQLKTSNLHAGSNRLKATYAGDQSFVGSTSAVVTEKIRGHAPKSVLKTIGTDHSLLEDRER